jgi:hypothetical protein
VYFLHAFALPFNGGRRSNRPTVQIAMLALRAQAAFALQVDSDEMGGHAAFLSRLIIASGSEPLQISTKKSERISK